MKKTIAVILVVFAFASCKVDPMAKMPEFNLLLADSTTILNTKDIPTGKRILLIHFDSQCLGCQRETDSILKRIELFKDTRLYFLTVQNIRELKIFSKYFKFKDYPNVVSGWDYQKVFPKHFNTHLTPYVAIYSKNKILEGVIEGSGHVNAIIERANEK